MSQDELSIDSKNDILHIKIIFENINIDRNTVDNIIINGSAYVFVATP